MAPRRMAPRPGKWQRRSPRCKCPRVEHCGAHSTRLQLSWLLGHTVPEQHTDSQVTGKATVGSAMVFDSRVLPLSHAR